MYKLVSNDKSIGEVELANKPVEFGRHGDNDIRLRGNDQASRFHCVVEQAPSGDWVIRDLGSRNGTFVNGNAITQHVLEDGDVIALGAHKFRVKARKKSKSRDSTNGDRTPKQPTPSTPESHADVRARQRATAAPWAGALIAAIDALPPKDSVLESVTLLDAEGRPSAALESEAPGSQFIRLLLLLARKSRGTDIHTEPRGDDMLVRMRVDGTMVTIVEAPIAVGELGFGVIKIASQIKQASKRAIQEGHFAARFADRRVDYRVSFTPTTQGQKLVLRVLDPLGAPQRLGELGFPSYMYDRLQGVCRQDAGMVLVCGPTGSGKTTTLYNALREIDRDRRNVITIEDPVEYSLEGVTQIPVSDNSGFGEILRSVLRQDPDVILVGEIRDAETAKTAMQAAMTGHVVFSTVHAKDTIGSIFRLLDLGVEPYLVANSIDLIVAQRLLRMLCPHCKRSVPVTPGQASKMGRFLESQRETYTPVGCAKCLKTGYRGRRAIFEMLDFNDELRDCVLNEPSITTIRNVISQGVFTSLQQAGWQLAARGETSMEEVDRVSSG